MIYNSLRLHRIMIKRAKPWLVWLSCLDIVPQTKRSWVQCLGMCLSWGPGPWLGAMGGCFSSSLSPSLPLSLKINKIFKKSKSPDLRTKGLLNKSWCVQMMKYCKAIKISGRIKTNSLKMIYNMIHKEKSDHKAIYPVWYQFCIRNNMLKKDGNICSAISSSLFQSRGIISDFIIFFALAFSFSFLNWALNTSLIVQHLECFQFPLVEGMVWSSLVHKYLYVSLLIHAK